MSKRYDAATKEIILARYKNGVSASQVSQTTGISKSTIYKWVHTATPTEANENKLTQRNIQNLNRKIKRLESMFSIIRSLPDDMIASQDTRLKYAEKLYGKSDYPLRVICDSLGIDKGTLLNRIHRGKHGGTQFKKKCDELRPIILQEFYDSNQIYGAGKMTVTLKQMGYRISEATVAKLMHEMGLFSVRNGSKKVFQSVTARKRENLIQQRFRADAPNQVWTSDVTYFKVKDVPYYICIIMDVYARKIIAHSISKSNSSKLTNMTVRAAYASRVPTAHVILHSDRGANYTSKSMAKLTSELNITQSFSRPGAPHDNAVTESFFSCLQREELYRRDYKSERDFRYCVSEYIQFYNSKRPHSMINYRTPDQAELDFYKLPFELDSGGSNQ
ncbi:MAG: IS3 family transposase [Eubacteriales bacterium]|nr:IS3 family transposase [Eubacteriales bacterium]